MHEMALSRELAALIEAEAAKHRAARVTRVVLEIGVLSHVDGGAMAFCFDACTRDTVAEGAALTIEQPPGQAWCLDCGDTVAIGKRGDSCPCCHGHRLMVTGGEDLRLKEMELV